MASIPQKAAYGTWKSPVTADILTQGSIILENVFVDDVTREIYHVERRPSEGGRSTIVNSTTKEDLVDKEWNVRTRVHEYGGLAATAHGGDVYFSNFKDGRVYCTGKGRTPEPVTPENISWRYASLAVVKAKPSTLVAVFEDHTNPKPADVVNKLVSIDTISRTVSTIADGADFYSFPCISPNGKKMCWIQWCHPDMPWTGSELMLADVILSGSVITLENMTMISGTRGEVSVNQPYWVSDDVLLFLNDSSGYVNPWSYSVSSSKARPVLSTPVSEDFAEPAWQFGWSDFAVLDSDKVLFASTRDGRAVLYLSSIASGSLTSVKCPYTVLRQLRSASSHEIVFLGTKYDEPTAVVRAVLNDEGFPTYETIKSLESVSLPRDIISKPQGYALLVPPSNEPVHVLYYPPFNPRFAPLDGEAPPAVVSIHGGPTARSLPGLAWEIQFWTSRGWAWVEINYAGSSGYGRKYRERLRGMWGVIDVNDSAEAMQILSARGLLDPNRTAIRGSSAGGYTVLMTLVSKPKVFTTGASLYGVSDVARLAADTHKFESRYADGLLGGTPEEIPDVYQARSPVTHADRIEAPLLILQGSADEVVPPIQAETIVKAIEEKGGRVKYILFDGEGHGWRKAENIKRGLEEELAWYEDVFGLGKRSNAGLSPWEVKETQEHLGEIMTKMVEGI